MELGTIFSLIGCFIFILMILNTYNTIKYMTNKLYRKCESLEKIEKDNFMDLLNKIY